MGILLILHKNLQEADEGLASNEELASEEELDSDEWLDVVEPDPADDDWYKKGTIYTDENGNLAEVFFDDYGMIEVAVNGLSLYYTAVDKVQLENSMPDFMKPAETR